MIITQRDDYRQMMVLMQEHLKRVGITLELNMVDHAFYHANIVKYVNPLVLHGDLSFPNAEIFSQSLLPQRCNPQLQPYAGCGAGQIFGPDCRNDHIGGATQALVEAQQKVVPQYRVIPTTYTYQPLVRNKNVDLGYELKSSLSLEYRYGWKSRKTA